jgi:hypothetical protein
MDNFSRYVVHALLGSLAALPVGCIVGGIAFGLWNFLLPGGMDGFWPNLGLGMFVAMVAVLLGIAPVFLYGALAYAFLAYRGHATLGSALVIGAIPSLLVWPASSDWATLLLLFGVPVAAALHLFAKRRMRQLAGHGSNNSSKPTPLRGAA